MLQLIIPEMAPILSLPWDISALNIRWSIRFSPWQLSSKFIIIVCGLLCQSYCLGKSTGWHFSSFLWCRIPLLNRGLFLEDGWLRIPYQTMPCLCFHHFLWNLDVVLDAYDGEIISGWISLCFLQQFADSLPKRGLLLKHAPHGGMMLKSSETYTSKK